MSVTLFEGENVRNVEMVPVSGLIDYQATMEVICPDEMEVGIEYTITLKVKNDSIQGGIPVGVRLIVAIRAETEDSDILIPFDKWEQDFGPGEQLSWEYQVAIPENLGGKIGAVIYYTQTTPDVTFVEWGQTDFTIAESYPVIFTEAQISDIVIQEDTGWGGTTYFATPTIDITFEAVTRVPEQEGGSNCRIVITGNQVGGVSTTPPDREPDGAMPYYFAQGIRSFSTQLAIFFGDTRPASGSFDYEIVLTGLCGPDIVGENLISGTANIV